MAKTLVLAIVILIPVAKFIWCRFEWDQLFCRKEVWRLEQLRIFRFALLHRFQGAPPHKKLRIFWFDQAKTFAYLPLFLSAVYNHRVKKRRTTVFSQLPYPLDALLINITRFYAIVTICLW